ncbi:MAG: hypothetical protein MUF57_03475, partial [Gammaproteobacteria bacterium]|nr:hypothetical protein [Gammaproteobacteria bacterium]
MAQAVERVPGDALRNGELQQYPDLLFAAGLGVLERQRQVGDLLVRAADPTRGLGPAPIEIPQRLCTRACRRLRRCLGARPRGGARLRPAALEGADDIGDAAGRRVRESVGFARRRATHDR